MGCNSGNSWISQNSNVHENLNSVFFSNSNTGYVAGGRGTIIKTITGGTVNINATETVIPDNYILHQNFPNPFNPSTSINYKLKSAGYISLKVFDVLGKEVSILVNEKQNAGDYSVSFNGTNLPSGIYFYRLEAGDFVECKMMVLIK